MFVHICDEVIPFRVLVCLVFVVYCAARFVSWSNACVTGKLDLLLDRLLVDMLNSGISYGSFVGCDDPLTLLGSTYLMMPLVKEMERRLLCENRLQNHFLSPLCAFLSTCLCRGWHCLL